MKQSSKYSLCDAAQNGINIVTFTLKDLSVTGISKLSNASGCRNKSSDQYGEEEEEGFKGLEDQTPVKLVVKVKKSVTLRNTTYEEL